MPGLRTGRGYGWAIRNAPPYEDLSVNTHRARNPLVAASLLSALLTTAACGGSSTPDTEAASTTKAAASVDTALLAFDPKEVRISAGQTVSWIGGDNITHVLVEGTYEVGADGLRTKQTDDEAFSLKLTKKGQQVSHTYDKAGTFTYFCTIPKGMNGTVTVS
jgi:plastocyanin